MTNTEYIEGMFEEEILPNQLADGKCPDCGCSRFCIFDERLTAIAHTIMGDKVEVHEQDEHNSTMTVKCQKCGKELYSE